MMDMTCNFVSTVLNAPPEMTWVRRGDEMLSVGQLGEIRFRYQSARTMTTTVIVMSSSIGASSEIGFIRDIVAETYRAKTPLGKRLLALRRAFVKNGGILLDADSLESEMNRRRGGALDA